MKASAKTTSSTRAKKAISMLLVCACICIAGWQVYSRLPSEHAADIFEQSTAVLPENYPVYADAGLDFQFAYPPGNGKPERKKSDGTRSRTGTYYAFTIPGYGDAAWIMVGTADLLYGPETEITNAYSDALFGNVTVSIAEIRQSIETAAANHGDAEGSGGVPVLIDSTDQTIVYALSDDGSTTYLTAVKHLPSSKRAGNVTFTLRVDTPRNFERSTKVGDPIEGMVAPHDLRQFKAIAASIRPYAD